MKKVLLVATVQSHIVQFHLPLISLLKQNGFAVHVAARDNLAEKNGLKLETVDEVFDIDFSRSPFSYKNVAAYKALKVIIKKGDYAVVHCNTPVGGVLSRLICKNMRKSGLKVFYTAHGFHFFKGSGLSAWLIYYPIEKLFSKMTDKIILISQEDYETAKKRNFACDVERIHSVGANTDKYCIAKSKETLQLRSEEKIDEKDFVCVCAGELLPNKNQSTLIKAMPLVLEKIPNFKLLLAGNGPMKEPLEALIKKLDLSDSVRLIGYRTDLQRFMKLSDVVASASIREGLGLNLVEAMLCGKPVIGSKNRGHNELIVDGQNGLKFEAIDEKGFADAVVSIKNDKVLYDKMSKNALEFAKQYTKLAVQKELKNIYEL
jgi:glycosyltransferase EpsD